MGKVLRNFLGESNSKKPAGIYHGIQASRMGRMDIEPSAVADLDDRNSRTIPDSINISGEDLDVSIS